MMESTFVSFDGIRYEFGPDGFPAKVTLEGFNGRLINAAGKNFSRINLRLSDGRTLIPFSTSAPRRTDLKKEIILDYPEILWKDDSGRVVEDFRLSMSYHLLTRGRAYVNAFFVANNMHTPEVDDFSIKFDLIPPKPGKRTGRQSAVPRFFRLRTFSNSGPAAMCHGGKGVARKARSTPTFR